MNFPKAAITSIGNLPQIHAMAVVNFIHVSPKLLTSPINHHKREK